jgi:radical SAM protein with 4Fe4S-binding SPASM domain
VPNNIPINKGNYTNMEPQERELLFNQYRSAGWEKAYWDYRKNWNEWPKRQLLSNYPLQVDAELSNICNLKCPMCFRRKKEYKGHGFMDMELFKKIVDEIKGKVPALRLSLRGESTLHPKFVKFVEYAKKKNIKEVSFLTNGSQLTEKYFEEILVAGADWITISIDGLGDGYEKIRQPLKFENTLKKIKNLKKIKKKHNTHLPVIKIQTVWPAISKNPQEYYNTFVKHVDLIAFNPLIDYLGNDGSDIIEYIDNFFCPQHYQRLVIGADGYAIMCTNDEENTQHIGDAQKESIHEIWHGKRLSDIRKLHKKNEGFKEMQVCRKCFLPRKTENYERAIVNGREFVIENYSKRSQTIGK